MGSLQEAPARIGASVRHVREGASAIEPREAARGLVAAFRDHDLPVASSAIAFRVFLALIPALLFVFGLLGFLGLDEVWRDDIVPELRDAVSQPAFKLIDDAVEHVLTKEQAFWVTAGALLATWEVSGVVRGTAEVLNRIYGVRDDRRPVLERFAVSYGLAAVVGALVLGAIAVVRLGPLLLDELLPNGLVLDVIGFALRWTVAIAMLLGAIGLVVRIAPDVKRPLHWVTFGALLVVGGWLLMSALFGLYLTEIADYGSIFGNLATIFVLLEYLYLASVVLLGGLVLDRLAEERRDGRS